MKSKIQKDFETFLFSLVLNFELMNFENCDSGLATTNFQIANMAFLKAKEL
jgi:hypothetical protein